MLLITILLKYSLKIIFLYIIALTKGTKLPTLFLQIYKFYYLLAFKPSRYLNFVMYYNFFVK